MATMKEYGGFDYRVFSKKTKEFEAWTGKFKSEYLATKWLAENGSFWQTQGVNLSLFFKGQRVLPRAEFEYIKKGHPKCQ